MRVLEVSILAFDRNFFKFRKTAKRMKDNGIKNVHYDVMDGKFVPNTAFEGEKLKYLIKQGFKVNVHLMVYDVENYIKKFVYSNISNITFHCEALENDREKLKECIKFVRGKNIGVGIAIKPNTKLKDYEDIIKMCDIITVMGVEPGFGGQKYMPQTTSKLKELKEMKNKDTLIELDGGVTTEIIKETKEYVDIFVSGSFLTNYQGDIKELIKLVQE